MVTLVNKKRTITFDDADYARLQKEFGTKFSIEYQSHNGKLYTFIRKQRGGVRECISIPRFLMRILNKPQKTVIFEDKNPLNMQRSNMQVVELTNAYKGRRARGNGTSKYKGVSEMKGRGKWRADIKPSPKEPNKYLGSFETPEEAAEAYNVAAKTYHGDFATLNIID
jgi:hypothetical protein